MVLGNTKNVSVRILKPRHLGSVRSGPDAKLILLHKVEIVFFAIDAFFIQLLYAVFNVRYIPAYTGVRSEAARSRYLYGQYRPRTLLFPCPSLYDVGHDDIHLWEANQTMGESLGHYVCICSIVKLTQFAGQ